MRQRLGLAAALLTRPRLLVLDEPANGLDPVGTRHVHRVLTGLAAHGTAVVLSSHRMDDVAALCSEVTLLAGGRVVFSGPLSGLAADRDELDYRLRASDPAAARRVAVQTPNLRVLSDDDVLVVRAAGPALDDLVARLVVVGVAVSLAWAVAATTLAYRLFMRRDFTDLAYDGTGRRVLVQALLPLAALLAVTVGVIAAATSASASGIDRAKLDRSLATAFAHLYRMQTGELHRPDVTEAQLRTRAACDRGGSLVEDLGPGNDWRCVVTWRLPGATATGSAIYQLDVTRTAATSPTATAHRRSTASSRSAPRRVTQRIPCGSSTAPSIC